MTENVGDKNVGDKVVGDLFTILAVEEQHLISVTNILSTTLLYLKTQFGDGHVGNNVMLMTL